MGKLFAHNTTTRCLNDIEFYNTFIANRQKIRKYGLADYATTCFNYIHQNPVRAGIVEKMEDWEFSSFRDYAGIRSGTLVNKELAFQMVNIDPANFYLQSQDYLDESMVQKLF